MKKRFSLPIIITLLITMLLSLNILNVYAYNYRTITIPAESGISPASVFPQTQTLLHSGGRYIVTSLSASTIYIYVFSSTGVSLSNKTLNPVGNTVPTSLMVGEVDSDEIAVFTIGAFDNSYCKAVVYRFNIYTFVGTEYDSGTFAQGTTYGASFRGGVVFEYNDNLYFVCNFYQTTNPVSYMYCVLFNTVSNVLTVTGTVVTTTSSMGWTFGFQLSEDSDLCYIMSGHNGYSTPHYYELDLDTRVFTLLADHPTGSVLITQRQVRFIGGDIFYDNDTDTFYLYFT